MHNLYDNNNISQQQFIQWYIRGPIVFLAYETFREATISFSLL